MTDTDIVNRLALEVGLHRIGDFWFSYDPEEPQDVCNVLARFAALVAEECAKVADAMDDEGEHSSSDCAERIRAKFKA